MTESASYIGRFAPSPTGDLHFGSLIAAVASFLQARCKGGKWLVRIEDIDPPREVDGSADRILLDLKRFGMEPDEPVLHQSSQIKKYRSARQSLIKSNLAFKCSCSRKSLPASGVYPGTCRRKVRDPSMPLCVRVKTTSKSINFNDGLQGQVQENLNKDCGDFVIWRSDKLPAYQLAVVLDDALQGISEVVRGADLLDSTCRQIYLQQLLNLPTPAYIHLPVATKGGLKLGKRFNSDPVSQLDPVKAISKALEFLGHRPPPGMRFERLWIWAIEHWNIERVPARKTISLDGVGGFQL